MKKLGCLFILVVLAGIMYTTNPSQSEHVDKARQMLKERRLDSSLGLNPDYLTIGEGLLGKKQMDSLLDKFIKRENYYLFSLTQIDLAGDVRTIGFGIFGHIFSIDKFLE